MGTKSDYVDVKDEARQPRPFTLVGDTITGDDHVKPPDPDAKEPPKVDSQSLGNQDAFGARQVPNAYVAVVCDGCGSEANSKTGSNAFVRIALNAVEKLLADVDTIPTPEDLCKGIEDELLKRVRAAVTPLAATVEQYDQVLYDAYLSTIWVLVATPDWTAVFGCGDGYYSLNGELKEVAPRKGNEPEYLTYRLLENPPKGFSDVKLKVIAAIDTEEVRDASIATDGIEPFVRKIGNQLCFSELWTISRYRELREVRSAVRALANPDVELKLRASVSDKLHGEVRASVIRRPGIFNDDTTFIVMCRAAGVPLPPSWVTYRQTHELRFAKKAPVLESVLAGAGGETAAGRWSVPVVKTDADGRSGKRDLVLPLPRLDIKSESRWKRVLYFVPRLLWSLVTFKWLRGGKSKEEGSAKPAFRDPKPHK